MAKTATDIEVKKTTTTNHATGRNAAPALQEQLQRRKWLWIASPAVLLIAGGAAFLIVRRQQRAGQPQKKRVR